MRIDLNNISLNGVEREDKTRKAGGKATSAPDVEDKTSLSVDTLSVSSLRPRPCQPRRFGRTRSTPCGKRSRTANTSPRRKRLPGQFWNRISVRRPRHH